MELCALKSHAKYCSYKLKLINIIKPLAQLTRKLIMRNFRLPPRGRW